MNPKLKPCKACGHEISRQAAMCPQCGQKHLPEPNPGCALAFLVIVALIGWGLYSLSKTPPESKEEAERKEAANKAVRDEAEKALVDVQLAGVITKLQASDQEAHAWVDDVFYGLDFDTKVKVAILVSRAKCTGHPGCWVYFIDSKNGKPAGRYSALTGNLEMEK